MSAACFGCDRTITGEAGQDPLIVVPVDEGDGQVGSLIFGKCCASFAPQPTSVQHAQVYINNEARRRR